MVEKMLTIAERLATVAPSVVAWFLVLVLGFAIVWLYRNTVPKDIYEQGVCNVLENQEKLAQASAQNTFAINFIVEAVKEIWRSK